MQEENNKVQNYSRQEAVKKLKELAESINIAMLCTRLDAQPFATCPMGTQKVEDNGDIWFFSVADSEHNRNIEADERVQLIYSHPGNAEFVSIYGRAEIVRDAARVEEYWTPLAKTWFQEGKDDPNLTLLRIQPDEGYYWDTKNNKMVAFLKMAASIVTGKTMDDGVQGKLTV